MAAYLIADLRLTDPAGFEDYRQRVLATIEQHGGRYLVRGGAHEVGEYAPLKALRLRTAQTDVVLVEGV